MEEGQIANCSPTAQSQLSGCRFKACTSIACRAPLTIEMSIITEQ